MNQFDQLIKNQAETEEKIIGDYLIKAGVSLKDLGDLFIAIENKTHNYKGMRNRAIKKVSDILRSNACGLRTAYAHSLISKVSGLSYGYVQRIAYDPHPENIIKSIESQ